MYGSVLHLSWCRSMNKTLLSIFMLEWFSLQHRHCYQKDQSLRDFLFELQIEQCILAKNFTTNYFNGYKWTFPRRNKPRFHWNHFNENVGGTMREKNIGIFHCFSTDHSLRYANQLIAFVLKHTELRKFFKRIKATLKQEMELHSKYFHFNFF